MSAPKSKFTMAAMLPAERGYDAWAAQYDEEDNPLVLVESRVAPRLLPALDGLAVLDLGCGTGRHSLAMAALGAAVTAVDFSEKMLSCAAAKEGADAIEFVRHDIGEPLPFDSARFDLVTCHLVTDHVADLPRLFAEMRRVCGIGGAVINTCMHPALHLRDVTARFIDPETGHRVPIETQRHSVPKYVMAAVRSGLDIEHFEEHVLTAEIAQKSPRAQKYVDWPMLLTIKLRRCD